MSKFWHIQGGVEVHLRELASSLVSEGASVSVFSSEDMEGPDAPGFDSSASDLGGKISSIRSLIWNRYAREKLRDRVSKFQPDIVHYHSIYHQLSPSVLGVADVPSVMTLHDFKLVAPCYTLVRDGAACTRCVTSSTNFDAVRFRCIKNSIFASAVCASETAMFLPHYVSRVNRFIVPSNYSKQILTSGGLPVEKISVIPWGMAELPAGSDHLGLGSRGRYWIFTGRLHPAKGVEQLLDAWQGFPKPEDLRLLLAGDGELAPVVRARASSDSSIVALGHLERTDLNKLIRGAEYCLIPSIQPETMGLSAIESLQAGTPLISSGAGALDDLNGPGVLNIGTDTSRWIDKLKPLAFDPGCGTTSRHELRTRDLSRFELGRMRDGILSVYKQVLDA
ncbi:glycosyltransferase family 4 protein [Williamsia sp. Leaf354]|uniref:glycosyltransferase family 4 protein n=1 Tax=Williamsia sp. Leaf354 TaxID=1736349 RepID=UPI00138F3EDB|nr:glycosyltransferase family 4 protein [Williamsia sp. Leaf354]